MLNKFNEILLILLLLIYELTLLKGYKLFTIRVYNYVQRLVKYCNYLVIHGGLQKFKMDLV